MPLLDHSDPAIDEAVPWESFHSAWATYLADSLNERWLTRGKHRAVEHRHAGPQVEIDVAALERQTAVSLTESSNGPAVATLQETWTVPHATCSIPAVFPESIEVRVSVNLGGWRLVGAVEFISLGNKDRPDKRRAFAAKCAGYLQAGVSVVIIDVVTSRRANLHHEILDLIDGSDAARIRPDVPLYAVSYRPVRREEHDEIDIWIEPCSVGKVLPTMPLRLTHNEFAPIEFEATYVAVCRKRGLI